MLTSRRLATLDVSTTSENANKLALRLFNKGSGENQLSKNDQEILGESSLEHMEMICTG